LHCIQTIEQVQNHADALQVDTEVASQTLNDSSAMYRLEVEHHPGCRRFRGLYQAELNEAAQQFRMYAGASRDIFECEKFPSRMQENELVFCCSHFLPSNS
jgi:hypothetical protein